MIVGIEVGGTFTDLVAIEPSGGLVVHKLPSTPADPSIAAVDGYTQILEKAGVEAGATAELLHGSTIAANALIQRKGASVGLLATAGFRDLLVLQRQDKTSVYDMRYAKPEPLIGRERVAEVAERLDGQGNVVQALDEEAARAAIRHLVEAFGIDSLAICLLHAYRNPVHELRLAEIAAEVAPGLRLSLSHRVAPEYREYERTSSTVIDAFVGPPVERYLSRFGAAVADMGFKPEPLIMLSNGGVVPLSGARTRAAQMFVSGPAAAVTAAAHVATAADIPDVISIDVGGTSCDVCLIDGGRPMTTGRGTSVFSVDGLPLNVVMTDIVTIGAGGGSIAARDAGGMLVVGPDSAGADPGPACYGKGGEHFTLSDALLVQGVLQPGTALPGGIVLDLARAEAAGRPFADAFDLDVAGLAERVVRIAVANMAQALRRVSVTRGKDPRDYALMPCGGAGPLVAVALAEEVGMRRILAPPHAGVFSALGLTVADLRLDLVRPEGARNLDDFDDGAIAGAVDTLVAEAQAAFERLGRDTAGLVHELAADLRYRGQGHELRVDLDLESVRRDGAAALAPRFHAEHEALYGTASATKPVELVSWRLASHLPRAARLPAPAGDANPPEAQPRRNIRIDGQDVAHAVVERAGLAPGAAGHGPVVLVEATTSTPIPPGWRWQVLQSGAVLIEKEA